MQRQSVKQLLPILVLCLAVLALSTPAFAYSNQQATQTPTPTGAGPLDNPALAPTATQSSLTFIRLGFTADVLNTGLRVTKVYENSPAKTSDLRSGDVVVGVGNLAIASGSTAGALVDSLLQVTQTVTIAVQRGDQKVTLSINANPPTPSRTPFRTPTPNPAFGKLGVAYEMLTEATAKQRNLSVNEGAYVVAVGKDTSADLSGVLVGDVIIEVDGDKVDAKRPLPTRLLPYVVGDELNLTIVRGSETILLKVKLVSRSTVPTPRGTPIGTPVRQVA